jgi:type IV pilus assembly protein PilM
MAGAVWGIDIGKAALKAVKLRATKEGLEIKAVEHFDYEGAADDDKRAEQVRDALKKLLAKHKLGNDTVLVALPGLHAFSRFIKLPPVDAKKIGMMVRMEAQQQIPFPIAEVNWDFQRIEREYAPGEEVEVGIFATQRERVNGFLADLKSQGIEPGVLTIAPLAIYNFATYDMDLSEATIILDIGSDHTDLVVVDGPRFWLRNLRIAGNDITKALAERFKVSFDEAEKLKRTASKSDQSKKIFSSMEPTLKDLVTEVTRSVGFFKSQASGGQLDVKKLILLGDGSKLKNLPSFLENELGFTVEKVSKLEQDKFLVDETVDMELLKKHLLGFGVALGLAIQGVGEARCAINLAPEDVKIQELLRRKVPLAAAAVVCSWAALGVSYVTWSSWRDQLLETVAKAKDLDKYKKVQEDAKAAAEASKVLAKKSEPLKGLVVNRLLPLDILRKLREVLPKDNDKIPVLTGDDRAKPLDMQREFVRKQREALNTDEKVWVLDLSIEKKIPGADPSKGQVPDGVYTVLITLGKFCPPNRDKAQARTALKQDYVRPLCDALKGEPFYLKKCDSYTPNDWLEKNPVVADDIVQPSQDLTQLDKFGSSAVYEESFPILAVDIKFEVGLPTPAGGN